MIWATVSSWSCFCWLYRAWSCPTLWDSKDCSLPGSSVHKDSLGKNIGVGCHALNQGIFPTEDGTLPNDVTFIAGGFFTSWATREVPSSHWNLVISFPSLLQAKNGDHFLLKSVSGCLIMPYQFRFLNLGCIFGNNLMKITLGKSSWVNYIFAWLPFDKTKLGDKTKFTTPKYVSSAWQLVLADCF